MRKSPRCRLRAEGLIETLTIQKNGTAVGKLRMSYRLVWIVPPVERESVSMVNDHN